MVFLLAGLFLHELTDRAGNQGIFKIAGDYIAAETRENEQHFKDEFAVFAEESRKEAPIIRFEEKGMLYTGNHCLSEYVKAVDYKGCELPVYLLEIRNERGEQIPFCDSAAMEVCMENAGIYTAVVSAVDEDNRRTESKIRLAVNAAD